MPWVVAAARCSATGTKDKTADERWEWDGSTGFLRLAGQTKCLAAVPPRILNSAAVAVKLTAPSGMVLPERFPLTAAAAGGSSFAKRHVELTCGVAAQLSIGAATQRDAGADFTPAGRAATATAAAAAASIAASEVPGLLAQHSAWWGAWWNTSSISLGAEWQAIEKNYYTMMYLVRPRWSRVTALPATRLAPASNCCCGLDLLRCAGRCARTRSHQAFGGHGQSPTSRVGLTR